MRTHLLYRRVSWTGALLAALLLIGCNDSKHMMAPGAGDPLGMTTEIHVTPTQFKAGETIEIAVTSRNSSSGAVTLHFSSGCLQGFHVQNENGTVVAPLGLVCTANAPIATLEAGQAIDNTFRWSGTTGYAGGGTSLPPGDYRITGHLHAAESSAASAPVE